MALQVAFFSPLPPSPTGVADYSQTLLSGLEKRPEIDVEAHTDSSSWVRDGRSHGESALALYQMGNSPHHDFIYPLVFRYPGVLVLHDLVLHHSRLASTINGPEVSAYRNDMGNEDKRARAMARLDEYASEVAAAYPGMGPSISEVAIRMGGGRLLYAFPLHELLVRASKMTLVHSHTAREEIEKSCPDSVIRHVRMGMELPLQVEREEARKRLGLGKGLILSSFGLVTPEKRISFVLKALRRLENEEIDAHYHLVGGTVSHYDAIEEARQLGIADRVHLAGRVSEDMFWLYAFASDICLNLRYPSGGETSATLLRLLATGRAVMVTDQTHVLDFSDDVVARVGLEGDEDGLYCDLMDLIRQPRRRAQLERSSRQFIAEVHGVDGMVQDYVDRLEEASRLPAPNVVLPSHLTS
jgi:glycosyltransferase involved in cell wall biosynthesis